MYFALQRAGEACRVTCRFDCVLYIFWECNLGQFTTKELYELVDYGRLF
jgi:hypothetical protein